jgi:hypothetical protein
VMVGGVTDKGFKMSGKGFVLPEKGG